MRRVVACEAPALSNGPVGLHVGLLGEVERGVAGAHDALPEVVYAVPLVAVAREAGGSCLWVGGLVVFYHVTDDGLLFGWLGMSLEKSCCGI